MTISHLMIEYTGWHLPLFHNHICLLPIGRIWELTACTVISSGAAHHGWSNTSPWNSKTYCVVHIMWILLWMLCKYQHISAPLSNCTLDGRWTVLIYIPHWPMPCTVSTNKLPLFCLVSTVRREIHQLKMQRTNRITKIIWPTWFSAMALQGYISALSIFMNLPLS